MDRRLHKEVVLMPWSNTIVVHVEEVVVPTPPPEKPKEVVMPTQALILALVGAGVGFGVATLLKVIKK